MSWECDAYYKYNREKVHQQIEREGGRKKEDMRVEMIISWKFDAQYVTMKEDVVEVVALGL